MEILVGGMPSPLNEEIGVKPEWICMILCFEGHFGLEMTHRKVGVGTHSDFIVKSKSELARTVVWCWNRWKWKWMWMCEWRIVLDYLRKSKKLTVVFKSILQGQEVQAAMPWSDATTSDLTWRTILVCFGSQTICSICFFLYFSFYEFLSLFFFFKYHIYYSYIISVV